jgi:hypothetical protein
MPYIEEYCPGINIKKYFNRKNKENKKCGFRIGRKNNVQIK